MNWTDLKGLITLYKLFFYRKVFSVGILRDKKIRISLLLLLLLVIVMMTLLSYLFFNGMIQSDKNYILILNIYSVTTFLWSVIIFIILKILFLKSTDLLKFTVQLPVSNTIRRLSLHFYELFVSFILIVIIASPIVLGLIINTGFEYFNIIITNILFVIISTYSLLNFLYTFVFWLLSKVKIQVNKYFTSIIFLGLFLIYAFLQQINWSEIIISSHIDNSQLNIPVLFFSSIMENIGMLLSFVVFLLFNVITNVLVIIFTPNEVIDNTKYVKLNILPTKNMSLLKAYVIGGMRLKDNVLLGLIITSVYFILTMAHVENIIFLYLILTINSIYSIVQSEPLRILIKERGIYSPIKDYLFLLSSNLLLVIISSIPAIILELIRDFDLKVVTTFTLLSSLLIIGLQLLGILFPPKYDNPFSIIVGTIILTSISIFTALIFMVFSANLLMQIIFLVLLVSLVIYTSIVGLKRYEGEM